MDVRARLLELLAPLAPGDEILPGVRLRDASEEIGPRLLFEVDGAPVAVEVAPADAHARAPARTARLSFSYVARGGRDHAKGEELCRAVARRATENEAAVFATIDREPAAESASDTRVREVRVTRLLEERHHDSRVFHTLSPYVGCLIGCRYCYAQSHVMLARRLARRIEVPWGSYVDVRVNAAEVLAAELARGDVRIVKFCPVVSDPYQAVEHRYAVTRACLETIARASRRPAVLVLTRSALIERDAALLGELCAHAGVSISTSDDEVRASFEPRAASVGERLAALHALRQAGAKTMAVVQPLLPGSVEALADAIATHCDSASVDTLRGVEGAADDFAVPRYRHATSDAWQREQADRLVELLRARGVALWRELPDDVA
jgi:DNA repair photolyase